MTGEWHWRSERGGGLRSGGSPRRLGPASFPSQGEAESWLGEAYPELLESGVHAVSLYEGDRLVYGPMGLHPEPS